MFFQSVSKVTAFLLQRIFETDPMAKGVLIKSSYNQERMNPFLLQQIP